MIEVCLFGILTRQRMPGIQVLCMEINRTELCLMGVGVQMDSSSATLQELIRCSWEFGIVRTIGGNQKI